MGWRFWKTRERSPCEAEPPQCGSDAALAALEHAWAGSILSPRGGDRLSPKQLAIEFRRQLTQPDLVGWAVTSGWVRSVYPAFARAQGVASPPAYRLFAEELARLLPRRRRDIQQGGRKTITVYAIRDPGSGVIELAAARVRATA